MNNKTQEAPTSTKKVVIIALVSVGVALLLFLLVFFGRGMFAGRAYFAAEEGGVQYTAGFQGDLNDILEKDSFTFPVGANLGDKESVAFKIVLEYDSSKVTPGDVVFKLVEEEESYWRSDADGEPFLDANGDPLDITFHRAPPQDTGKSPRDKKMVIEHATIDWEKPISGPVHLVDIPFTAENGGLELSDLNPENPNDAVFKFETIEIYELDNPDNNIVTVIQPSGEIACPDVTLLFGRLSEAEQKILCARQGAGGADLNNDGKIDNDDVTILQLALEAIDPSLEPQRNCGAATQNYCDFNGIWVCENADSSTTNPGTKKCSS